MISSVAKAPRFGSGRLVVDGTDATVTRKAEFSVSPTTRQGGRLEGRDRFYCPRCGRADHADLNAATVIAARGRTAEAAWQAKGAPPLTRPKPRLRRRKPDPGQPAQAA